LAIAKWKPFGRFSRFSAMMPWASHKLRSGTTDSKAAACRWRAMLVPGRHSTSQNDELIDQVRTLVMQDHCVTVRELAEEVGINTGSVHSILTNDLAMRRVSMKLMLKLLTMQQKQLCPEVLQDLLDYTNNDLKFLNTVTTGDESCVYRYDPKTMAQSPQWKHSTYLKPKKARQVWSNVKVMLTIFFTPVQWCKTSTHHKAKTLTKNTTWKSFFAFVMLYIGRDRTCRQQEHGSCIMTMHELIPCN